VYTTPRYLFQLSSNPNRPLSVTLAYRTGKQVQFGENYYGTFKRYEVSTSVRMFERMRLETRGVWVRERLLDGPFFQDRRFLISRWLYQITPKWRARVLAQYQDDKHGHELSISALAAYDFTARTALYLGYNRQRRVPLERADLGNEVFVKLSYLFSF
jgi:hypothetical protein